MILTWMYHDLKGSDESVITRNLINSLGLSRWNIGATRVACGGTGLWASSLTPPAHTLNAAGYRWLLLLSVVFFTTLQIRDFRDTKGDKHKQRRTLPLMLGDTVARLVTSASILIWSLVCPLIWRLGAIGIVTTTTIGAVIAARLICFRSSSSDELTWKLWGLWMLSIFVLPLMRRSSPEI